MKIQFLNGGLANQAFQYIFSRYYELSHPGDVMYLDDTYFMFNTVHNGYELENVFGIHPHMLSECFDERVWNYILEQKASGKSVPQILSDNQVEIQMISEVGNAYQTFNPFDGKVYFLPCGEYHPEILEVPGNMYYHGYWINKNWFESYKSVFLEEFRFPEITDERNRQYMEQIINSRSVAIHIRRGDYVDLNYALSADMYQKEIHIFISDNSANWHLFVFSDDIEWCKEHAEEMNFSLFQNVTFVEGNILGQNYRDMQLMSRCKGMIISNSAFCFLAALLNTEKQIIVNCTDREL